jgi:hypothetical protein
VEPGDSKSVLDTEGSLSNTGNDDVNGLKDMLPTGVRGAWRFGERCGLPARDAFNFAACFPVLANFRFSLGLICMMAILNCFWAR